VDFTDVRGTGFAAIIRFKAASNASFSTFMGFFANLLTAESFATVQ
jgi:hypothetical protein